MKLTSAIAAITVQLLFLAAFVPVTVAQEVDEVLAVDMCVTDALTGTCDIDCYGQSGWVIGEGGGDYSLSCGDISCSGFVCADGGGTSFSQGTCSASSGFATCITFQAI